MSLRLVCTVSCELDVSGGVTQSVLKKSEAWLQASSKHQRALKHVARRKDMERYRSVLDFVLCELFPEHQAPCRRFYAGKGPRLVELESSEEIERLDTAILRFLAFCWKHKENGQANWTSVRFEALRRAA